MMNALTQDQKTIEGILEGERVRMEEGFKSAAAARKARDEKHAEEDAVEEWCDKSSDVICRPPRKRQYPLSLSLYNPYRISLRGSDLVVARVASQVLNASGKLVLPKFRINTYVSPFLVPPSLLVTIWIFLERSHAEVVKPLRVENNRFGKWMPYRTKNEELEAVTPRRFCTCTCTCSLRFIP